MLIPLYLFGFLSTLYLFEIEANPLMKNKRDVGDMAQIATLYAVEEFNNRAKSPIGGEGNYKIQGAGKELDINYGATLKDQFSRRRRSPEEAEHGNDHNNGEDHGGPSVEHGGSPPNNGHGGPPPPGGPPGGHPHPPHHNRKRRSPCGHKSTTPAQNED